MPNFKNRTLFHGENLDILRGMDSETVDLIATDPPFNKGRDFHATPRQPRVRREVSRQVELGQGHRRGVDGLDPR